MNKRNLLAGIIAVAALGCAAAGVLGYGRSRDAGESYDEIRESAREETGSESASGEAEDTAGERNSLHIPIDFQSLQNENPDVCAWITIPGTEIDYPIVQHPEDNGYYLTHNVEGEEDVAGAIFIEDYNSSDFTDPNTLIYGHNMRNGSMFQNLHNYMDRSFFDENREIIVYLPDQILHYEIFAAYLHDSRHLMLSYDFEDPEVFARYLDEVHSIRDMSSFVDASMEVGADDRIITLSTCYKGMDDRRYLVQAVLVSIET